MSIFWQSQSHPLVLWHLVVEWWLAHHYLCLSAKYQHLDAHLHRNLHRSYDLCIGVTVLAWGHPTMKLLTTQLPCSIRGIGVSTLNHLKVSANKSASSVSRAQCPTCRISGRYPATVVWRRCCCE